MNELKITIKSEVVERFKAYTRSDIFLKENSLVEHWAKRQQGNIDAFDFKKNQVTVTLSDSGLADHYPQSFGYPARSRGIKHYIRKKILNIFGSYNSPAYDPIYHFNQHWPLGGEGVISYKDIIEEFGRVDDYGIIKGCYFFNEINLIRKISGLSFNRILEIGPGTGILLRMLKKYHAKSRIIIVDLPTSLGYSFCQLLHRFPSATFCLPHEVTSCKNFNDIDFIFLTNSQISLIPENFIDLAINTHSFQEMKIDDISIYFHLLRKVMKNKNIFYCLNAVEKPMKYNDKIVPIRFFEYPWLPEDMDYKYEISPVEHGRTYKPFYVRALKMAVSHL